MQTGGLALGTISTRSSAGLFGQFLRVGDIDDAAILAFGVDELDLDGANIPVDARPAFLRSRGGLSWDDEWPLSSNC